MNAHLALRGGTMTTTLKSIFENPVIKALWVALLFVAGLYFTSTLTGFKEFMQESKTDRKDTKAILIDHIRVQSASDAVTATELRAIAKAVDDINDKLDDDRGREALYQKRTQQFHQQGGKP